MTSTKQTLDQAFLEQQRQRLTSLREQLLRAMQAGASEEAGIQAQSLGEAHEVEDDAQRLAMLDVNDATVQRNIQRLKRVERSLQKLRDGSYGFSDASGEPIPRERLEAVPDAIYTLAELMAGGASDER